MSSHREAPQISKDPVADNTDVYAFVSPDKSDTVTLIANFVPLEDPDGGATFFEFGDDISYEINIDNDGDGLAEIVYQFQFRSVNTIPTSFLYNVGPIKTIDDKTWNRKQFYNVVRHDAGELGRFAGRDRLAQFTRLGLGDLTDLGRGRTLGSNLRCPPCNIGPGSTPQYLPLANEAIHSLPGGRTVFAGQRAEGCYVDLGAIFDLGDLRPFQNLNAFNKMPASGGRNSTKGKNIHSIVLQVPKTDLTANGKSPTDPANPASTVGVWAIARRQKVRLFENNGTVVGAGPFVQVSRLANPLVNEVLIPIGRKDFFNSQPPVNDSQFVQHFAHPELAQLLPVLYPGVFPHLDVLNKSGKPRADIEAIFLTGIPAGLVPGFQNFTGTHQADLQRLNMAIPPTPMTSASNLGLIGGDPAGFPNGRRVFDDVTTIELRALAGVTYALVDKTFTPDAAAGAITPGLTSSNKDLTARNTEHYLPTFPYLGTPHAGYDAPADDNTPFPVNVY